MRPEDQERFPPCSICLRDGTEVVLRLLSTDDAEALGDFYESIPGEDFRFYCPHPLTRQQAAENAAGALSPLGVVLVMETERGEIGGYAWYRWQDESSTRSTFGICIRRDFQGKGAGRALMTRSLEIAREVGPPVMGLTVQKANPNAVELYRKTGFETIREQVRPSNPEYGFEPEPEYYMELRVR